MTTLKTISLVIMGSAYIAVGMFHFINPGFFLNIMPPSIPFHLFWVYLSGAVEIALGVALLIPPDHADMYIPRLRQKAAWGVIVLLIAVYPANIHMALNPEQFADMSSPIGLYVRLALQFVLAYWAYTFTGAPEDTSGETLTAD